MGKTYKGDSRNAEAPFLSGEFWKKGTEIIGTVKRTFMSVNGLCYVLELPVPVKVGDEELDEVSVGNLAHFRMAIQDAGLETLKVGDQVHLACSGIKPPKKEGYSPSPEFEIEIIRPSVKWEEER